MCRCCKTFLKIALMVKNFSKNCPNIEICADGKKHWWKTLLTIQRDGLLLPSAQWETYFNFLEFLSILSFETGTRISFNLGFWDENVFVNSLVPSEANENLSTQSRIEIKPNLARIFAKFCLSLDFDYNIFLSREI